MRIQEVETQQKLTPIKFNFFELKFTPFKGSAEQTTKDILLEVAKYLNLQQQAGQGFLTENRGKETARPLFITQISTSWKEKRVKASIALLRTGKIPKLKPADSYVLMALEKGKGEIAEETHFFIDFSTPTVVMCIEFNNDGPRMSDIEYYLRIVAHDKLDMAKSTNVDTFMEMSVDKALAEFKNVVNIQVKIQPEKLAKLDPTLHGQYYSGVSNLKQYVDPSFVKLELLFESSDKKYRSKEINKKGNTMFKRMLESFNADSVNMDVFDNFVVRYEKEDGKEDIFNLLKGKKEVVKLIDPAKLSSNRAVYESISGDIDLFMEPFND